MKLPPPRIVWFISNQRKYFANIGSKIVISKVKSDLQILKTNSQIFKNYFKNIGVSPGSFRQFWGLREDPCHHPGIQIAFSRARSDLPILKTYFQIHLNDLQNIDVGLGDRSDRVGSLTWPLWSCPLLPQVVK